MLCRHGDAITTRWVRGQETMLTVGSGYRPDIDGMRAIAVVSVLLFHSAMLALPGGYVGVDVFFVISGYVIALSLKRDLDDGRFSLWRFYERRARRILPALTIVLLATLGFAVFLAPPGFFDAFHRSFNAAAVFLSNVHFWRESGYFNVDDHFRPLLHTWSLGVEEQFYILAPLLIFAIHRYLRGRWAIGFLPIIAVSFALGLWEIHRQHINAAFYLPHTRAFELLLGAVLALSPPPQLGRIGREALSLAGVALIILSALFYTPVTPFPGFAALAPTLGAAFLIHAGGSDEKPLVNRVLAWRPIVAIGLISYSLYLVHWPVLVLASFGAMRELSTVETVIAVAACFLLATLMYWLVERPARRVKAPRFLVLLAGGLAIVATLAAGWIGARVNQSLYAHAETRIEEPSWRELDVDLRTGECMLAAGQDYHDWSADRCVRTTGPGADILLFGDSFAAHYTPGLEALSDKVQGRVIQYTMQGCPPLLRFEDPGFTACAAFLRHAPDLVRNMHIKRVVVAGSWLEYGDEFSLTIGPTLKTLRDLGAEVTLIGQSPNFYFEPFAMAARLGRAAEPDVSIDIGGAAAGLNARMARIAADHGVQFINPVAELCAGSMCPTRVGGQEQFVDYGHFTPAGSRRAVAKYFPYLAK
jgi:peptidoglycan/LPS O-acetylase OafA/YrhL